MADLTRTVEIVFGATSTIGSTLTDATSQLDRFDAAVQSVAAPVASFAESLLKAEAAVAAAAATMLAFSVNEAGRFGDGVLRIGTNLNATTEELGQFNGQILEFARTSASSLENINQALYDATSVGLSFSDAMTVMAEAERLAVVGMSDVAQSTDLLTSAMAAYGAKADEVERYSAALFTTVQGGKITVDELAQGFGRVAPAAAAAGVPIEQVGAAIAALTVAGLPAQESITYLAGLFKELLTPSDELRDAMGGLSVSTDGLAPVMGKLKEATGGSADKFFELFKQSEAARAAIILANDTSGTFAATLLKMADNTGIVAQNYELMGQAFDDVNQRVVNNLRATLIEMGIPFLDEYGNAAKALSGIFEGVSIAFDAGAFDPVYAALDVLFDRITEVLDAIAKNLPDALKGLDWTEFLRAVEGLGDALYRAFVTVFGEIDVTTVEGLNDALQTLVDLGARLIEWTTGVVDGLKPVWDLLGEGARQLSAINPEVATATGNFMGAMIALEKLGTYIGGAAIALSQFGTDYRNVGELIEGIAKTIVNSLQTTFDLFAATITEIARVVVGAIDAITPDALVDFQGTIADLDAALQGISDNLSRNAGELVGGVESIGKAFGLVADEAERTPDILYRTGGALEDVVLPAEKAADSISTLSTEMSDSEIAAVSYKDKIELMRGPLEETGGAMAVMKDATIEFSDGVKSALPTLDQLQGTITGVREEKGKYYATVVDATGATREEEIAIGAATGAVKEMSTSLAKNKDATLESTKAAQDFEVRMEQIASNERIKYIEAVVKLDVARIEAETEQVKAAFESLNTTIESSGDLIASLVGDLAGLSGGKYWLVKELIEKEFELREKAVEKQLEMIAAYIKLIEARTELAKSGNTLFKIEASGLSAHLEKILWELLKAIQLRATEEGAQWLVGCGGLAL